MRADGTILFQRGWWELPDEVKAEYAGEKVWVHIRELNPLGFVHSEEVLEVAHPGLGIFQAANMRPPMTVFAHRNDRPDAKPGVRLQWRKDYIAKMAASTLDEDHEYCKNCGEVSHKKESTCISCGADKPWATNWAAEHPELVS